MGYLDLIGFWVGFAAGCWIARKYTKHPEWVRAKLAELVAKLRS
jgi:hypothetical protein